MQNKKKLRYTQWKWICRSIGLLAAILILFNYYKRGIPFVLGLVLLLITLVVAVITLRCPYCGYKLGDPPFTKLERCPHCGKELSGRNNPE